MVEENYNPIINPVIPDFATKVNAGVNGFITNESGEAVEGATITAGTATTTTDEFGYFKISNTQFSKTIGFIQVSKTGYFTGYSSFSPVAGKETFTRLKLIPKTIAGTVDSDAGGTASIAGGATVTLPANAVVVAASNSAYSGTVNIAAHWFDPADMTTTSLTMPGNLTGVDSAGHLNVLQTFGMLAVELTGSSGELLQIAAGKKASLHFPLPSSLQSTAPVYIPLWYFDETKGVWKQEGHAVKSGNSYDGEVSHFSFWNCDVGLPFVNFTAQFTDTALNPLVNIPVVITSNIFGTGIGYTDTAGRVTGMVPANAALQIDIMATCNDRVNATAITTTNAPVDLGTIPVNLNEYTTLIEGTVTKCNGNPVTDGYVIVASSRANFYVELNNGFFSISSIVCPGTNAAFIAFDRETSQRSEVRNMDLVTGLNIVEPMQVCTASTTESITVTYNSPTGPLLFTIPQYMFGGNFYFANDSTSINAIDLLNSNQQVFQMSFTGPASTGLYPLANSRLVKIGSSFWQFEAGTSVNITSYGLIGQFITGTLNGNATMISQPITRLYNIEFSIQRDQ